MANSPERIRVLYVVQGLRLTGPGRHLVKLLTCRNPDTVEVELFTFDRNDPKMLCFLEREHGIRVSEVGFPFDSPIAYLRGVPRLVRCIHSFRPHVIQTHHTPIVDWIARAASKFERVPLNVSRAVVMPKVYHTTRRAGVMGKLIWLFVYINDRMTSHWVDYYLPNSLAIANYMHEVEKISKSKIIVIPNGVDVMHFSFSPDLAEQGRRFLNLAANDRLISNIGFFKEAKGQMDLVLATLQLMDEFPEMKVAFVGKPQSQKDEAYLMLLKQLIHENRKDEKFVFTGELADVRPILAASKLYVHPSYLEGAPNAVLEAMAMGCACIVSDADGCKELFTASDGIVVPRKDIPALRQAIRNLWLNDRERLRLADAARERVVGLYSVQRMCAEVEAVYRLGLQTKGIKI